MIDFRTFNAIKNCVKLINVVFDCLLCNYLTIFDYAGTEMCSYLQTVLSLFFKSVQNNSVKYYNYHSNFDLFFHFLYVISSRKITLNCRKSRLTKKKISGGMPPNPPRSSASVFFKVWLRHCNL